MTELAALSATPARSGAVAGCIRRRDRGARDSGDVGLRAFSKLLPGPGSSPWMLGVRSPPRSGLGAETPGKYRPEVVCHGIRAQELMILLCRGHVSRPATSRPACCWLSELKGGSGFGAMFPQRCSR